MNSLHCLLMGAIVAITTIAQARSQPAMIWDRSYNDLPPMTVADVQISDSGGLLIVGQASQDAVYRVVESDGFNSLYLTLRTNSFQSRFHAVYPIGDHRLFVQCNSCWVQSGDNVTRLYSATENGLGGYVVPPGRFGYAIPMQVQQDGAIVGGAARHTTGSRHGWVADKWRWGATAPEWSSDVIMATVDGQTSGGFFPSNMRVNRTHAITPAGNVTIQSTNPPVRQPFWFSLTPSGVPLWTQTAAPSDIHFYMADESGAQLFSLAENIWDRRLSMYRPDGSLIWTRALGQGRYIMPVTADSLSDTTAVYIVTDNDPRWMRFGPNGQTVFEAQIPRYGRNSRAALQAVVDGHGGQYVLWRAYDGPFDNPVNQRLVLVKHDEFGRSIWEWEVDAHPSNFVSGVVRISADLGYFVSVGAQRIVKFRIRAAFVEGDASGDGCIDDKDLAMTLEAFGTSDPSADFDSNGIVDDRDLERVLRNFGLGCVG